MKSFSLTQNQSKASRHLLDYLLQASGDICKTEMKLRMSEYIITIELLKNSSLNCRFITEILKSFEKKIQLCCAFITLEKLEKWVFTLILVH